MKNLFDFATKELSQDAFLRWLFENYEELVDDQLMIRRILGLFAKDDYERGIINDVKTYAQYNGVIDVAISFKYNHENHFLVMENKTQSYIHSNQLKKYYDYIEKDKINSKRHYCYFKSNRLDDATKDIPSDAEDLKYLSEHKEWNVVTLKDLYNLLFGYESKNIIFNQFIQHINKLYKMYYEFDYYREWDLRTFEIFVNQDFKHQFKKEKGWDWSGGWLYKGFGAYVWFCAKRKYLSENDYIELAMQFRINEKHIWANIKYYSEEYDGNNRKQMSIKDKDKVQNVKKIIEDNLNKYFNIRLSKGKQTLASFEKGPELYFMDKEKFIDTINEIRIVMEKIF